MQPVFPERAAYALTLAHRLRYVMQMNAREAMHLIELRSGTQGHPVYRRIAQEMHRLIAEQAGHRILADAMTFVDHSHAELERLEAERRSELRRNSVTLEIDYLRVRAIFLVKRARSGLTPSSGERIVAQVPDAPRLLSGSPGRQSWGGMAVRGGGRPAGPSRKHSLDSLGERRMAPKVPGPGRRAA
jgi:hypothetical protein